MAVCLSCECSMTACWKVRVESLMSCAIESSELSAFCLSI